MLIITMEKVPGELVMNWNQSAMKLVPSSSWTLERRCLQCVEIIGADVKKQIMAVCCGIMLGEFLPPQLIDCAKTSRCNAKLQFPNDWNITHAPEHWSTEETMIQYIHNIIIPYVQRVRCDLGNEEAAALVMTDNFKGQTTEAVLDLLESNNILVTLLPLNTTNVLYPVDLSVNKAAKH